MLIIFEEERLFDKANSREGSEPSLKIINEQ